MKNVEIKPADESKVVDVKEVALPSGKKATIKPFKGRDIREAQKISGTDTSLVIFAIIAVTTTIDGNPVTAEELDDMDGMDVFELMNSFGSGFIARQSK
jgi:hypothetical protein